jgi:hypothetical protein
VPFVSNGRRQGRPPKGITDNPNVLEGDEVETKKIMKKFRDLAEEYDPK